MKLSHISSMKMQEHLSGRLGSNTVSGRMKQLQRPRKFGRQNGLRGFRFQRVGRVYARRQ